MLLHHLYVLSLSLILLQFQVAESLRLAMPFLRYGAYHLYRPNLALRNVEEGYQDDPSTSLWPSAAIVQDYAVHYLDRTTELTRQSRQENNPRRLLRQDTVFVRSRLLEAFVHSLS